MSNALHEFQQGSPEGAQPFGHVILAAADVSIRDFVLWYPSITECARNRTLYFSDRDFALLASQGIHLNDRVGQGPFLTRPGTPHNVDSQKVDTAWLGFGHDYISRADELLIDLQMILVSNKHPDDRETIRAIQMQSVGCWEFP